MKKEAEIGAMQSQVKEHQGTPRVAASPQHLGKGQGGIFSYIRHRDRGPANILISDFSPQKNKFLLF